MNRYPLNTRVLGAGSQIPLTMATAVQVMYLAVAATARSIRWTKVNGTLANTSLTDATITRAFKATQQLTIASVIAPSVWFTKYISAAGTFALQTSVTVHHRIRRTINATQTFYLTSVANQHRWVKTYAQAVQNFGMSTKAKYGRLIQVVVNQVQAVVMSLRILAKRHWKIAGSPALVTVNNARKAVLGEAVSQAMQLAYESIATRRTAIHATAARAMTLVTDVVGRTASRVEIAQAAAINYVANARVWIIRRVELAQALRLSSFVDALDATSRPATVERTVAIPNLSRTVVVPGESYISGV